MDRLLPQGRAHQGRWGWIALSFVLFFGAIAVAWIERRPLTAQTIRTYLVENGVDSIAHVSEASPSRIVFDDVRLGPTATPDIVARRIIVDVGWAMFAPRIDAITLDAAVVRAHVGKGGISFGSLDRLIPPGRSVRFPAIAVKFHRGLIILATPGGRIVGHVEASGRLDRDFKASVRTDETALRVNDCSTILGASAFQVATQTATYEVSGQGKARSVACAGVVTPRIGWRAEVVGALSLARLDASATVDLDEVNWRALNVRGGGLFTVRSTGDLKRQVGNWQVRTAAVGTQRDYAGASNGNGTFDWRERASFQVAGEAAFSAITSNTLRAKLRSVSTLPEPAAALATQLQVVAEAMSARVSFDLKFGDSSKLEISHAEILGKDGARITLIDGAGFQLGDEGPILDGHLAIGGAGLPNVKATLFRLSKHSGAAQFEMAPWTGGGSVVAIRSGGLTIAGDRLSVTGAASVSYHFAGGSVDGLTFPLAATIDLRSRAVTVGHGCAALALRHAVANTISVGPTSMTLCPLKVPSLMSIAPDGLTGRFIASSFHVNGTLAKQDFSAAIKPVQIEIGGTTSAPTLQTAGLALQLATLKASSGGTVSGKIIRTPGGWRGSGEIHDAAVTRSPIDMTGGSAAWHLDNGELSLASAAFRVAESGANARFEPLQLTNIAAWISPARVRVRGDVRLAGNRDLLGNASGAYDFASKSGTAHLTSSVTFSPGFQPQQISELSRGVIANVEGALASTADINVDAQHVAATGTIKLAGMSLATASLGPVTGIEGTVVFDDLFALHTLPRQLLHIGSIDPGVRVEHGVTTFQLLGVGALHIETMDWPFAGGMLRLQPVTLRTDERRRTLTLDVDGLDAEQFLQRFELKNVNVTGLFDGTLPLVFDGGVGRIEHGMLTARKGGGLLQYVGEVGQDSMGGAGRIAFDALRRLRYQSLVLRLDGDLDGELVTAIDFAGTNELPVKPAGGLPLRAAGLPFKFGVTVRAPFRALLGTAASFGDARAVLRSAKPQP